MTYDKEIILKIVEEKKQRIKDRKIPELVHLFLFGEGGGQHWSSWINNHDDKWKSTLSKIIRYKSISFTQSNNYEILNIELIDGCNLQFEYTNKFTYVIDGYSHGNVVIYINEVKLMEFDLSKQSTEWGSEVGVEELKYLKETSDLDLLIDFLSKIQEFVIEYNKIEELRREEERIMKFKDDFNIRDEDIYKYSNNGNRKTNQNLYKLGLTFGKKIKKLVRRKN